MPYLNLDQDRGGAVMSVMEKRIIQSVVSVSSYRSQDCKSEFRKGLLLR